MTDYISEILNRSVNGTWPPYDMRQLSIILFGIGVTIKSKSILELGVRSGESTLPLLTAANIFGGILESVDIMDTEFVCPDEMKNNWIFTKSDSIEYLEECVLANDKFDLIFVDDWHAGNHVYKELCLIDKLIEDSSLVLLHDLMWSASQPKYNRTLYPDSHEFGFGGPVKGVSDFIKENKNYEYITIPVSHGLTILRKFNDGGLHNE